MNAETADFLAALGRLPAAPRDVESIRQRRLLLASLFDEGPADVLATDGAIAGVPVRRFVPPAPRPTHQIVYVHGGGWVAGDLTTHDGICRRIASVSSTEVAAVDYARPPEAPYPTAVGQVASVIAAASREARVLVAGDSSGGHIAVEALVALEPASALSIEGLLLVQPACDPRLSDPCWKDPAGDGFLTPASMRWFWQQYVGDSADPLWAGDLRSLPRTVVLATGLDPSRGEAAELVRHLCDAGVPGWLISVPDLPHACFTLPKAFPQAQRHLDEAVRLLTDPSAEQTSAPPQVLEER